MTHETKANYLTQLPDLTHIDVAGADATSFLHGQFCADLLSIPIGGGCFTAWCSARGRVITTLFAFRKSDGWTLILPANLAEKVSQRLKMFVLRAQVELHPAAADDVLLGLNEASATILEPELQHGLLRHPEISGQEQRFLLAVSRADYAGLSAAPKPGTSPFNAGDWARRDVETGLPWIDAGTTEQFLPQELNLEHWQGLSYTKGCYPGQEIVARLRYRGTVKRGLFRLLAPEVLQSRLVPGSRLLNTAGDAVATVLYTGGVTAQGIPALAVVDFNALTTLVLFCEPGSPPISVIGAVQSEM